MPSGAAATKAATGGAKSAGAAARTAHDGADEDEEDEIEYEFEDDDANEGLADAAAAQTKAKTIKRKAVSSVDPTERILHKGMR